MSKSNFITMFFATSLLLVGCSDSEEAKPQETETATETKPAETEVAEEPAEEVESPEYTADNAYQWLKDSGLVSGEPEDVTAKFEGSEGLVKAIRTEEADIIEFEKDSEAASYHDPDLNSYAVKNIFLLIKKGQDNAENFISVVESGAAASDLETAYSSDAQKEFVESTNGGVDFVTYVDGYYNLPDEEKSSTYDSYIVDKEVTWSGTIADLNAIGDSIVVYGKEDYSGEDWEAISTEKNGYDALYLRGRIQ